MYIETKLLVRMTGVPGRYSVYFKMYFVASDVKEEMETTKVQSRFKGLRTVTTPIVTCFDRLP